VGATKSVTAWGLLPIHRPNRYLISIDIGYSDDRTKGIFPDISGADPARKQPEEEIMSAVADVIALDAGAAGADGAEASEAASRAEAFLKAISSRAEAACTEAAAGKAAERMEPAPSPGTRSTAKIPT
jgi:hypothetical protein